MWLSTPTPAAALTASSTPAGFGFMSLIRTDRLDEHPWFKGMGPEPLGPDFTAAALAEALKGRSQAIKNLLLDQRLVAGLGNIYVCEALHRSGDLAPSRVREARCPGNEARRPLSGGRLRTVLEEGDQGGGAASTLR